MNTYLILIRPATGPAYHARCTCDGQPTAAVIAQALLGDVAGSVLVRAEPGGGEFSNSVLTGRSPHTIILDEMFTDTLLDRIDAERQAWGQVFQLAVNEMQKTVARSIARDIMTQPMPSMAKPCGSDFLARKQRNTK